MPATVPTLVDGFASLEGGMDRGLLPTVLQPNQTALAINTIHRTGALRQRPRWVRRLLTWDDGANETLFNGAIFQCMAPYRPVVGEPRLVCLAGGRVFVLDPAVNYRAGVVAMPTTYPDYVWYGWMCQAEQFLVIQDGISKPLIYDGGQIRQARYQEIKPGRAMVYAHGRIWYVLPDGKSFRATDLVYGDGTVNSVLKETENDFLNEGGDFKVPSNGGDITAILAPAMPDTGLGQGPVHIFTQDAIYSVNAPVDRTVWKDLTYPIQTVALVGNGAMGARNTINHNGDIFYRGLDGIRSYALSRREFSGDWGRTPISRELGDLVESDPTRFLEFGSAVVWKHWMLMTVAPNVTSYGVVHKGLVALDLSLNNGLRRKLPASWDGLWTGLDILQLATIQIKGQDRLFALARGTGAEATSVFLYELEEGELWDEVPASGSVTSLEIERVVETGTLKWGDPRQLKRLVGGRIEVEGMHGDLEFTFKYRPDGYPGWFTWQTWTTECANVSTCLGTVCDAMPNYRPSFHNRYILGEPDGSCIATSNQRSNEGYEFQFRLEVSGVCTIKKMLFYALPIPEPKTAPTCTTAPCSAIDICADELYSYEIEA